MRYQIIGRHMSPSESRDYRDIVAVQYRTDDGSGICRTQDMVKLLRRGHTAFVRGQYGVSEVDVFDLNGKKYLRTYRDNDYWDDSLQSLPVLRETPPPDGPLRRLRSEYLARVTAWRKRSAGDSRRVVEAWSHPIEERSPIDDHSHADLYR